ncbi:hypothetical protein SISSUDRAFT_1125947 [Sistotremastrum suecicum HHB10207 ss-3]|uniref:Uncharacterized protein n=1 Tax=Sistotremastrum suecicum HHB10207 ss-3 TaxID=1314776 RepID=A0A166GU71_9AGAM|nr:hypothetical protein SISSUDRAFT_1125947 [Sistotremastrum suecicum HHB10207 ss-3]
MPSFLIGKVLPVLTFLPLTYLATQFLVGHLIKSGVAVQLRGQCPEVLTPSAPFRLNYFGIGPLDKQLCILVTFFSHALKSPLARPTVGHLLSIFPSFITFPILESVREGAPLLLAFPAIIGLLYQTMGGAVILPIYWTLFIIFGDPQGTLTRTTNISAQQAEGAVVAIIGGFVIPTLAMYITVTPRIIAAWQLFPVWISLFQFLYMASATTPKSSLSGGQIILGIHLFNFLVSAVSHLIVVLSRFGNLGALHGFFVPSLKPPRREKSTIATGTLQFLKWDGIIIAGSSVIATLWFGRTLEEVFGLLVWNVVASAILGPAAAFSGALVWREIGIMITNFGGKP